MSFEFAAPARILVGEGTVVQAAPIGAGLGTRALVVQGASGRAESLVHKLRDARVDAVEVRVPGEPTTALIEDGIALARRERCDLVVALGGGSVIDAGKAIAALLTNGGQLLDYLETVGNGRALTKRSAPLIAIPTTAGTGAEVTRNAVVMVEDAGVKASLRSPLMLAAAAIVDPGLTYTLPPAITASTGMDALTQCIEPFVSPQANPLTDAVAREGMHRAARALRRACRDGRDVDARRDMALASLCGGLALANAKLGAVHGFAAPLGGMFPIPHGTACARLLAPVVNANVRALRSRAPDSPALARYDEIASILTGRTDAAAEDAATALAQLTADLGISPLSAYGVDEASIPGVVEKARVASSMQGNPIVLSTDELVSCLTCAL